MREYLTKQRKALLSLFEENPEKRFSTDDIMKMLPNGISRSAVYRNLDRMSKDGFIEKTLSDDENRSIYRFVGREKDCERLHLRCEKCGKTFHFENENDENKLNDILNENGLILDRKSTLIVGVCEKCK